jgi:hypothetical protein
MEIHNSWPDAGSNIEKSNPILPLNAYEVIKNTLREQSEQDRMMDAFSQMSQNVLKNPENISEILKRISDSTLIEWTHKTELMLHVMERHADITNDTITAENLSRLKSQIQDEKIRIAGLTSLHTGDAMDDLQA